MKNFIPKLLIAAALPLSISTVFTPALSAQEHKMYHDNARNEDHEWNSHEDKAYRMWVKEQHRKYKDFGKLKREEQEQYWAWRRDHSDAILHIDIH